MTQKPLTSSISNDEILENWDLPGGKKRILALMESSIRATFVKSPSFPFSVSIDITIDSFAILYKITAGNYSRFVSVSKEELSGEVINKTPFLERLAMQLNQLYRLCINDPNVGSDQASKTISL